MTEDRYKQNPYEGIVNKHLIKFDKERKKTVYLMDNNTGQMVIGEDNKPVRMDRYEGKKAGVLDDQVYIKVFGSSLHILTQLTEPGFKIMIYIMMNLKPKTEKVEIILEKASLKLNYRTTKSVRDGLNNLLDNNVIARSDDPNFYWINPTIFYNGSRRHLFKEKYH